MPTGNSHPLMLLSDGKLVRVCVLCVWFGIWHEKKRGAHVAVCAQELAAAAAGSLAAMLAAWRCACAAEPHGSRQKAARVERGTLRYGLVEEV